ncbi:MAG: ROK family protein, partial [Geobacteraceae bacterium]|nr:ROK family protein [Geobacteraceae bacterium]
MLTDGCVIGIDIGGTSTSFGFVDRNGSLASEATLNTEAD